MTLYTIPEAAAALHVPEGWLRKKVSAREVPHTRLGKHVRFTDAHLSAIVDAGEQPTTAAPAIGQGVSRLARKASSTIRYPSARSARKRSSDSTLT